MLFRAFPLLFLLLSAAFPVLAQTPGKVLQAVRVQQAPRIDGQLDEEVWTAAPPATEFIQNRPVPGKKERLKTEARVLYDDAALYIGAILHDVSPDSILREIGKRDQFGNTDYFGVFLDTYNDDLNAFGFYLTPAGVQIDSRFSSNGEDYTWNAVWESSAQVQGNAWVVEMKIPFSAIRFPKTPVQVWGLNFVRERRRTREGFYWNPVDPAVSGFVNQFGQLHGLRDIQAPLRLALIPYVAAYAENVPEHVLGTSKTSYRNNYNFTGGMDLKYGISDAFTLDMTLIPDFGQVISDNQVLNLSPFEVQFNENRPFFMEGTELFNKGGFFYSRRVGGRPLNFSRVQEQLKPGEVIESNPIESRLLNATKVSGRTPGGLGVGLFNAITAETNAVVKDAEGNKREIETQPLTNYNIVVLDQSLRNNSYVSLINTWVLRQGSTYDANLTGTVFRLVNKTNTYAIDGKAALSQQYYPGRTDLGYTNWMRFGKVSGNFQWSLANDIKSHTYNPNDLGILFANNDITQNLNLRYNIYEPFWKVNNLYTSGGLTYSRRYDPNTFQNFVAYFNANTTFRNFTSVGLWVNSEPVPTYDFFEPRVYGRFYRYPVNNQAGAWYSTDYRKKFALDLDLNYRLFNENERHTFGYSISPRYRASNQLSFIYSFNNNFSHDDMGFARLLPQDSVIFGRRDVNTYTNTLTGNYIFNNRMSLSLRARHYWSQAVYREFYFLSEDGSLSSFPLAENRNNVNFNAFNIDMVYSWWFAPGSQVSVVWKNAILREDRGLAPSYFDDDNYFRNFSNIIAAPQNNSISIKVLYYLDYLLLKQKLTRA